MRNIIPEELHEQAELLTGSPKPMFMMQGIDSSFKAAFFVGYHAMRGASPSILEHTYNSRVVYDLFINGKQMGETGVNGAIAGYHGVPVAMVTGDSELADEAKSFFGRIVTVAVKKAASRTSACCLSPAKARQAIREGAVKALNQVDRLKPFIIESPLDLKVVFINPGLAEIAGLIPGSERVDSRTPRYRSKNLLEAYRAFLAMIMLAGTVV
jgi:D-amino peptidase